MDDKKIEELSPTTYILRELSDVKEENRELANRNIQLENKIEEDKAVQRGKTLLGTLPGIASGIALAMDNSVGRWIILQAKDFINGTFSFDLAKLLMKAGVDHFKALDIGKHAFLALSTVANTIIANPALIPVIGGIIVGGVGAITGKIIAKSKLKHKNLTLKPPVEKKL